MDFRIGTIDEYKSVTPTPDDLYFCTDVHEMYVGSTKVAINNVVHATALPDVSEADPNNVYILDTDDTSLIYIVHTDVDGTKSFILGSAKPDWNENDSSAAGYIENRTHWKEDTITSDLIVSWDKKATDVFTGMINQGDRLYKIADLPSGMDYEWVMNHYKEFLINDVKVTNIIGPSSNTNWLYLCSTAVQEPSNVVLATNYLFFVFYNNTTLNKSDYTSTEPMELVPSIRVNVTFPKAGIYSVTGYTDAGAELVAPMQHTTYYPLDINYLPDDAKIVIDANDVSKTLYLADDDTTHWKSKIVTYGIIEGLSWKVWDSQDEDEAWQLLTYDGRSFAFTIEDHGSMFNVRPLTFHITNLQTEVTYTRTQNVYSDTTTALTDIILDYPSTIKNPPVADPAYTILKYLQDYEYHHDIVVNARISTLAWRLTGTETDDQLETMHSMDTGYGVTVDAALDSTDNSQILVSITSLSHDVPYYLKVIVKVGSGNALSIQSIEEVPLGIAGDLTLKAMKSGGETPYVCIGKVKDQDAKYRVTLQETTISEYSKSIKYFNGTSDMLSDEAKVYHLEEGMSILYTPDHDSVFGIVSSNQSSIRYTKTSISSLPKATSTAGRTIVKISDPVDNMDDLAFSKLSIRKYSTSPSADDYTNFQAVGGMNYFTGNEPTNFGVYFTLQTGSGASYNFYAYFAVEENQSVTDPTANDTIVFPSAGIYVSVQDTGAFADYMIYDISNDWYDAYAYDITNAPYLNIYYDTDQGAYVIANHNKPSWAAVCYSYFRLMKHVNLIVELEDGSRLVAINTYASSDELRVYAVSELYDSNSNVSLAIVNLGFQLDSLVVDVQWRKFESGSDDPYTIDATDSNNPVILADYIASHSTNGDSNAWIIDGLFWKVIESESTSSDPYSSVRSAGRTTRVYSRFGQSGSSYLTLEIYNDTFLTQVAVSQTPSIYPPSSAIIVALSTSSAGWAYVSAPQEVHSPVINTNILASPFNIYNNVIRGAIKQNQQVILIGNKWTTNDGVAPSTLLEIYSYLLEESSLRSSLYTDSQMIAVSNYAYSRGVDGFLRVKVQSLINANKAVDLVYRGNGTLESYTFSTAPDWSNNDSNSHTAGHILNRTHYYDANNPSVNNTYTLSWDGDTTNWASRVQVAADGGLSSGTLWSKQWTVPSYMTYDYVKDNYTKMKINGQAVTTFTDGSSADTPEGSCMLSTSTADQSTVLIVFATPTTATYAALGSASHTFSANYDIYLYKSTDGSSYVSSFSYPKIDNYHKLDYNYLPVTSDTPYVRILDATDPANEVILIDELRASNSRSTAAVVRGIHWRIYETESDSFRASYYNELILGSLPAAQEHAQFLVSIKSDGYHTATIRDTSAVTTSWTSLGTYDKTTGTIKGFVIRKTDLRAIATSSKAGMVQPIDKTDEMTQDVGIDAEGKLYTKPSPDLPTSLKNPYALVFTGASTQSYDGSSEITVKIPEVPTDDIAANTAARHSHTNKAVLDSITGIVTADNVNNPPHATDLIDYSAVVVASQNILAKIPETGTGDIPTNGFPVISDINNKLWVTNQGYVVTLTQNSTTKVITPSNGTDTFAYLTSLVTESHLRLYASLNNSLYHLVYISSDQLAFTNVSLNKTSTLVCTSGGWSISELSLMSIDQGTNNAGKAVVVGTDGNLMLGGYVVPMCTTSDAGKILVVGTDGKPEWAETGTAEISSF